MSQGVGMLGLLVFVLVLGGCAASLNEADCARHLVPINLPAPDNEPKPSDPAQPAPSTLGAKARP